MTIHCTSTDIETIHQASQDNYLRLSTNALHFIIGYTQDASQRTRRNSQRNIIWFYPPFSKSVNTNIGREFLSLIDKHFPLQHKLHKIFNRDTLKISYIVA
jgi:hypothetical protein